MENLNFPHKAVESYRSGLRLCNYTKDNLQSEDAWKMGFRSYTQALYSSLYKALVKLSNFGEALCAAGQGRIA